MGQPGKSIVPTRLPVANTCVIWQAQQRACSKDDSGTTQHEEKGDRPQRRRTGTSRSAADTTANERPGTACFLLRSLTKGGQSRIALAAHRQLDRGRSSPETGPGTYVSLRLTGDGTQDLAVAAKLC